MRGFPLLNLLITLLLSGAVLWPLVHRATSVTPTAAAPVAESSETAGSRSGVRSRVSLRLVHAARSVRIKDGSAMLHEWKPGPAELQIEENISLLMNDQRTEFTVQIDWPENTPDTMAELRVEPDGLPARSANLWSSGSSADEVVSLTWKGEAP